MDKILKIKNKKQFKNNRGITLVALIITVILMLILAGVAISAVIDGDGLFRKSREAKQQYENSAKDENKTISNLMNYIDKYMSENLGNNKIEKVDTSEEISKLGVQVVADSSTQITITTTVETSENYEGTLTYLYYINNEKIEETTETTKVIQDLTPNTFYTIYVIVQDRDGGVKYSEDITIKTKERIYLYKAGDECVEITGGWKKTGYHVYNYGVVTKNNDNINMYIPGMCRVYCGTSDLLQFTNYSKLYIEGDFESGTNELLISKTAYYNNSYEEPRIDFSSLLPIDISSYTGKYYLHITIYDQYSTEHSAVIKNIWIE